MADFFQGSPVATTSTSMTAQPQWYQDYIKNMMQSAQAVATIPYTPYEGPRIAEVSPYQQQATNMALQNVGAWQPFYQQGAELMGAGAGLTERAAGIAGQTPTTFDPAAVQQFVNPYLGGVLDEIAFRGNQNLTEGIMPGVNTTFTGAGQFGSTRNADFLNRSIRDTQREITGAQASALKGAYDTAMGEYQDWSKRPLEVASSLSGLAQQESALGKGIGQYGQFGQQQAMGDVSTVMGIGETEQARRQAGLDMAYQDFLNQLNYPKQLLEITKGAAGVSPQSTTTTNYNPSGGGYTPSTGAQLAGGLSLLKGIYDLFP